MPETFFSENKLTTYYCSHTVLSDPHIHLPFIMTVTEKTGELHPTQLSKHMSFLSVLPKTHCSRGHSWPRAGHKSKGHTLIRSKVAVGKWQAWAEQAHSYTEWETALNWIMWASSQRGQGLFWAAWRCTISQVKLVAILVVRFLAFIFLDL